MREETGDAKQRWRETVLTRALAAHPDRRPAAATSSGIPVDLLYDPSDLGRFSYPDRLGYPGDYPYTRGVQATIRPVPWHAGNGKHMRGGAEEHAAASAHELKTQRFEQRRLAAAADNRGNARLDPERRGKIAANRFHLFTAV